MTSDEHSFWSRTAVQVLRAYRAHEMTVRESLFMERLTEAFKRFRGDYFEANRARFERLADRPQHPRYAIVTCRDSRIHTTRVFDAIPGELFLIRNIANLVPPYEPD
jgi:carbonic anhydrase